MGKTANTPGSHLCIGAGAVAPSDFGLGVRVTAVTNEVMSRIGFDTVAGEVEFVTLSERSLAFIDCVRVGS